MAKISAPSLPLEKIAALSRVQRILICVGVFLILGGSFTYLIYMPRHSKIQELKKNLDELETKVAKARSAARDLKKFQERYKAAEVRFKLAIQLLPDKKEIPTLLEAISKSGRDAGLEFILFKPGKEISRDFYAEIPVIIEVKGGYHNLAMFFDKVARLPRIVNILDIRIRASKGAEGLLNASCVAMTYKFLEGSPAKTKKAK